MLPILEKGRRRCKGGSDPGGIGLELTGLPDQLFGDMSYADPDGIELMDAAMRHERSRRLPRIAIRDGHAEEGFLLFRRLHRKLLRGLLRVVIAPKPGQRLR